MYRVHQKKSGGLWFPLIGAAVILASLATVFILFFSDGRGNQSSPQNNPSTKIEPIKTVGLETKILFAGDVFWGRYVNDWSRASSLKTAYPFSKLSGFARGSYDAWIGNLECPSVHENQPYSSAKQDALLSFNCDPSYLAEASKWFDVFSLANNHTDNRNQRVGFEQTQQNLSKNGVQYFGDYDPEVYKNICEVVSINARVTMSDKNQTKAKLPIALCGYHGVFKIPSAGSLAQIKKYAEVMPTFAMAHSGAEYKSVPDKIKTTLYRNMIDNGADAVFGGHPHWVQPAEVYKNRLIAYSMGNFIFDQQLGNEVTRSASFSVDLSAKESIDQANLQKWLEFGVKCSVFHDNCLTLAKAQNLQKIPFNYTFKVVGGDSSNKITRPASPDILSAIKQRLDWSSVVNQLQLPYSAKP